MGLKESREPVLIQGEPGTGKELVTRALHYHSDLSERPFIKVNLSKLKPPMLDEIFIKTLPGQSADPEQESPGTLVDQPYGTILLEGIETLPAPHQSRLLNIFEDCSFQHRQSANQKSSLAQGRMVVTSNKLLEEYVQEGRFRQDLFYRLNVISVAIPPLRERTGDIPMLMDFFADKFCMELGVGHIEVTRKFKDIFCCYHWPGNVRELQIMTRRAILNGDKDSVMMNLSQQWAENKKLINQYQDLDTLAGIGSLKKRLTKLDNLSLKNVCSDFLVPTEKKIITKALEQTNWNRKKAAGFLDISYKSLLNKIKKYKLAR